MNRYNLIKEYGSWLNGIKWDYFSTLTYKYETNSKRNRMIMNKLSYLLNDSDVKYEMFWINEFHKSGLSTHNHLLYRGNENLKDLINTYWFESNFGNRKYSNHIEYQKNKGASYYISKHIYSPRVDYEYINNL